MSIQLHTDNQSLIISATAAATASYALFAATASYAISSSLSITSSNQSTASLAVTASYAQTASSANYLFVGNNLTAPQTASLGVVIVGTDPGQSNLLRVGGSVLVGNQIELNNFATQSMNISHPAIYGTGNTGGAYPFLATGHLALEPRSGSIGDVVIIGTSKLTWATDNISDIGYSGTHRPRTIYIASSSVVGTDLGTFDVVRVSGSANFSGPVTASAFSGNIVGSASYASTASSAAPSFVIGADISSSIDPNTYALRVNSGIKVVGPIESWNNATNAVGVAIETSAVGTSSVEFRASDGSKRFAISGSLAASTVNDRLTISHNNGSQLAFIIDGSGRVGIGNNINPQFNLDVSGTLNVNNTSSFANNIVSSSVIIKNLQVSGSVQIGVAPTTTYAVNADGNGYVGVFRGLWSNGSATFTITSPAGLADIILGNGAATGLLVFGTVNTNRWQIDTSGVFEPSVDNTYDFGRTTLRPRNLRIASASVVGTDLNTFDVMRVSGSANFSGPVTASAFIGDGTQITNVVSASFASSSYTTLTASYSKTASVATNITFVPVTASYASTASVGAPNFFVSGTETIIGSILINNFTASVVDVTITGSLAQTGSHIIVGTVTASLGFSGSIQSASFASMSYTSLTASNATTASYTLVAQTVLIIPISSSYATTSSAATSITFIPATASYSNSASFASSSYTTLTSSWAATSSAANTFFIGNTLTVLGSATIQTIPIGLGAANDSNTIAIGANVLVNNISGIRNIGIGVSILQNNTRGSNIVAIGYSTLPNNTVGNGIVAIGYQNLSNNQSGSNIVSIGQSTLGANRSGSNIVAIGFESLLNATGSGNVAIGNLSGLYEPGANTFYLDNQDRGGLLASRTGSLFYGIFDTNSFNQFLAINANIAVSGTLTGNSQGIFSGQATANGYAFYTDQPSGIFSIATNRFGAYTNGQVVAEFDGTSGKRIRFYGVNPVNTPHITHNDNLTYGFLLAENAAPSFSAIVAGGESMRWSTAGILISASMTPFVDSTVNIGSSANRFLTGSFAYITGTHAGNGAAITGIITSSYATTASYSNSSSFANTASYSLIASYSLSTSGTYTGSHVGQLIGAVNTIIGTTSYTSSKNDYNLIGNTTSGSLTILLPDLNSVPVGYNITIYKPYVTASLMIVPSASAQFIGGQSGITLSFASSSISLFASGGLSGSWFIKAGYSSSYTTTSSYAILAQSVLGTINSASYAINASTANYLSITNSIYANTGSAASPAYSFLADSNSGIYRIAANRLGFVPGSSLLSAEFENQIGGLDNRRMRMYGANPISVPHIVHSSDVSTGILLFGNSFAPSFSAVVAGGESMRWSPSAIFVSASVVPFTDSTVNIGLTTTRFLTGSFAYITGAFAGNGSNLTGITGSYLSGSQVILEVMPANAVADGMFTTKTAGEALVFGDVVFFATDSKVWKAHATGTMTYPVLGMAATSMSAGTSGKILLTGNARLDTWAWSTGSALYLATSSKGQMTTLQPNGSGHVIQVLGFCHPSSSMVYFNPSRDYITHV